MKILVTGGAGFIGSFLTDKLIDLGYHVTIFDNLEPQVHQGKKPSYLNPKAKFIEGDVRNVAALKTALKDIDIVFHEAAAVGVAQSNYEIKRYIDVNVGGTANLLDIIVNEKLKIKKILTTSSMTAYGEGCYRCETHGIVEPPIRPWSQLKKRDWHLYCPSCSKIVTPTPTHEDAAQPCNSIYALSKKTQEDILHLLGSLYDIPVTTLRCFNVYGPRQSLSNPYTGVTAIFISRLKNNQPPLVFEDGGQTRDFVSVHDVVDALILAMDSQAANHQICNIGTGTPTSVKDIALTLAKLMGKRIKPTISQTPRKNDIRHCYPDIHKAQKLLKWKPKITLHQGLRELVDWSLNEAATDKFNLAAEELKQKGII
ncbi:MAG: SDR family NAD(P)-dependent oxidoreductase [Candidatus Chisholmbacteria bacterium]|nr:SDR family NAD(P)-dependent oxidoreductase [Candidatus Chisholmbacteria bacterium]